MKKSILAFLFVVVCLVPGQPAVAAPEMGFRLNLGIVPGVDDVDFDFGGKFPLDEDNGGNFNPAFVIRTNTDKPVGFVGVFGLFSRTHSGSDIFGNEAELTAYGVSIAPGIAVKISDQAHFEFKGHLDLGGADQSLSGFTDGDGPYAATGLSAGFYVKLNRNMQIGGEIGYMDFASDAETYSGGFYEDVEISGSGLTLNIGLGFIF